MEFHGTVLDVIDGDTVHLSIDLAPARGKDRDLGFHVYVADRRLVLHYSFRLLGLNAAEHGTPQGDDATAYLRGLLPAGQAVKVTSVGADKFNRFDAVLTLPDGRVVNDLLIAAGRAAPWNGQGPKPVAPWPIPEGTPA